MSLRVVTDSTADLNPEEIAEYGLTVVPLTVFFGEDAFLDRVEITPEEFYRRLREDKRFPRTSQPAAGLFEEAYAKLAAEGADEIISVHISSKLSGTLGAARVAAGNAPAGCKVIPLDSMSLAGGLGAMAKRAATIGRTGGTAAEAAAEIQAMIPRHRISILLDTLEYLQKGGRIGRARALLGGVLNVKPIVRLQDGEVGQGERVRSRSKGIDRLFEGVLAQPDLQELTVEHTGASEAEELAARLRRARPELPVDVRWIGPVVGTYVGPNGIGAISIQRTA
jgi:DegV family protein with EDD domain